MPSRTTQVERNARHRAKRRRVEVLLEPQSPESAALDKLIEQHGSAPAAVRFALLDTAGRT